MENKKVIIITEIGQISSKDKEKLTKAGFLVIEAKDPQKVRFLNEAESIDAGTMLMAALHGVVNSGYSSSMTEFSKDLYKRLKKKEDSLTTPIQ